MSYTDPYFSFRGLKICQNKTSKYLRKKNLDDFFLTRDSRH